MLEFLSQSILGACHIRVALRQMSALLRNGGAETLELLQLVPREAQLLLYLRWIQELRGLALPRLELLEEGGNGRIEGARAVEHRTFGP